MKEASKGLIKPSLRCLLSLISLLEKEGEAATAEGWVKILRGILDEETQAVAESVCFGYLPSLSSKKLKNRFHLLVRKGYLRLVYNEEDGDYYLLLSERGRAEALPDSLRKKPRPLSSSHTIRKIKQVQ